MARSHACALRSRDFVAALAASAMTPSPPFSASALKEAGPAAATAAAGAAAAAVGDGGAAIQPAVTSAPSLQQQIRDALATHISGVDMAFVAAQQDVATTFAAQSRGGSGSGSGSSGVGSKPHSAAHAAGSGVGGGGTHADIARLLDVIQRISEENASLVQVWCSGRAVMPFRGVVVVTDRWCVYVWWRVVGLARSAKPAAD